MTNSKTKVFFSCRSSSSSKLFVSLFQVLVSKVQSLVSKILPNPKGFVISSHISYASSKEAFNYCIRRVKSGKSSGSMEALIFHRNITKTLCPSDECDQFKVICLYSSSFKLFVCLVLIVSCLFVYFKF